MKSCKYKPCSKPFKQYSSLDKYCSYPCKKADKAVKHIRRQSKKREAENVVYLQLREIFLKKPENKICFIEGCKNPSDTVEHRAGRWGKNYLDTTTWAGCCSKHNTELENNPELSKKYQLSKITGKKKL